MTVNFPFNPVATTTGAGLFAGASSTGLVQGTAYPDPSTRFQLRGGILAATETIPMWGGVGIYELIPGASGGPNAALGPVMGRATGLTGSKPLLGFSVFDQAYGMLQTPQSPVPLAVSGMQVMSYRLGSGARLALACDPALVDLAGDPLNQAVAWDFVNQRVIPYTGAISISSGTYNTSTGEVELTLASNPGISEGDSFTVSAATGTGSFASINGSHTATADTAGAVVSFTIATGLTMTITGGSFTTGSQLTGVSVLDVQPEGCMVVDYDSTSGAATWDYDGACVVLQI